MQKTKSKCQDNVTGQGFETLLRREPRQKPTKEEPGADVFCEWSCNSGGRDVVSCRGKMVRFMLSRLSPSIIFNHLHSSSCPCAEEGMTFTWVQRKEANMAATSFPLCCPVSTIRRNCKEKCETSCESVICSEFFFADAESMETVTTFLQPSTAHLNHSSLYFDFSHSQMIPITFQFRSQ